MKIIITVLSLLIFQINYCQDFIPFQKDGLYGFSLNGDEQIAPTYEYATDFSNGLACVKSKGKWGYINESNEWVVKPTYEKAQPYRDGYAKVSNAGKIGVLNEMGEVVAATKYDKINIGRDGLETRMADKLGFVSIGWKDIPTKYERVGKVSDSFAFGKNEDNSYDIYTKEGLFLTNQKHSFSDWSKTKDGYFICSKDGKYGLYSESMTWVLEPKFDFIQKLRTNVYSEIDMYGDETNFSHVFAVFESLGEDSSDLSEKTAVQHNVKLLRASSLQQIGKNVVGYEQLVEGYGYNREYDYKLDYEDGSDLLISNFLYPNLNKKAEANFEELILNGYSVLSLENGNVSLIKDGKSILTAKSISKFSYVTESFDDFGDFYSESRFLESPYLWIVRKYDKAIFNTKTGKLVLKNLPLATEYEAYPIADEYGNCFHLDDEIESYLVRYNYKGKFGVLNCKIKPTDIVFERIDLLRNTGYVKVLGEMTTKGKTGLSYEVSPTNVSMEADDFISSDDLVLLDLETNEEEPIFKDAHFVIIKENNKYGFLGQKSKEDYFDTILPSGSKNVIITVIDGVYGVYDLSTNRSLAAKFKRKPEVFTSFTYPDIYVLMDDQSYLGIDGKSYSSINDLHYVMETDQGTEAIGYYDDVLKKYVRTVSTNYKSYIEDQYPYFRVKGDNGLWGMINHKGDTVMPFEFSDFGEPDLFLDGFNIDYDDCWRTTYSKKGLMGLYSTQRGELIPPQFNYYEELYDLPIYQPGLFWTQSKKGAGVYNIESGEVFPPEYDYISTIYDELGFESDLLVAHKGKYMGLLNLDGEKLLNVEYDFFQEYQEELLEEGYPYIEIGKKKKSGIYSVAEERMIMPIEYDYIENYYEGASSYFQALVGHKKKKIGIHDLYGNMLFEPVFDYDDFSVAHQSRDTVVITAFINGKFVPNILVSNVNIHPKKAGLETKGFDCVAKYYGYDFEGGQQYATNLFTNEKTISNEEIIIEGYNFDIYVKDGKFGARSKDGTNLIDPIYDNASVMEYDVMIGYEDGVKYYIYVETNERYTEDEW